MLSLPYQSYVAWRICVTSFHVVAILSTLVRIRTRYQSRRMWLDDYMVTIPMTVDLFYCLSPWVLPWLSPDPRTAGPYELRNVWATLLVCFSVIWISRICFMLSLARIFPLGNPARSFILSLVLLFALFFSSIVLLLALHCDPDNSSARHCAKFLRDDPATIYAYSMDVISDIIMIVTPLAVLWKVKLPKLEKRVILAALSSSVMTLPLFGTLMFFTLGPVISDTLPYGIVITMLSNLTAAASLLSCNTLVVVTSIFRLYRRRWGRTEESGSPEATSIDFSIPTGHAPHSVLAFDLEKTKEDANQLPRSSYDPNLHTISKEIADSEASTPPLSMYILTQITMDEYDYRCDPPDSTNLRSRLSEAPISHTRVSSVLGDRRS